MKDDVAEMVAVDELVLPPKKPIAMRPGGMHIMLMGLKKQLKEGDKVPLTLSFLNAGKVDIEAYVQEGPGEYGSQKAQSN
jgi:copper(I)-binding protein